MLSNVRLPRRSTSLQVASLCYVLFRSPRRSSCEMTTPMPPMMPMGPPAPGDMPPMGPSPSGGMPPMDMDMPTMHVAFFWGHRAQVIFPGWPGDRAGVGMYILCLLVVAALAALVEALSAASRSLSRRGRGSSAPAAMVITAGVHAVKMGVAYMVMLGVMSFNAGVFLAVVAGHAAGFVLARRGVLGRAAHDDGEAVNGALPSPEPKP
ncbi:hypothetical protein ACP70R_035176 [Stipagrostis hirtigluma subsp. patula]